MPLINCEVNLTSSWRVQCVISSDGLMTQVTTFVTTDTKFSSRNFIKPRQSKAISAIKSRFSKNH